MNTDGASWRNRAPLIRSGESNRDRRRRNGGFWGASKHSPIISQRKTNSSSSAVTHMYAAPWQKTKHEVKRLLWRESASRRRPDFTKQNFSVFFCFSLQSNIYINIYIVWATEISCCEHQVGLLKREERKPHWQLCIFFFFGNIYFLFFWVWCSRGAAVQLWQCQSHTVTVGEIH